MYRGGVQTVTDKGSVGESIDTSGPAAQKKLSALSISVINYEIVPDDMDCIAARLIEWVDKDKLDIIVTTGGTGLSPRDVTPEATMKVIEKMVPGLSEAMRIGTMKHAPTSILSRAIAGSRGKCLIINLPGSQAGVEECITIIAPVLIHGLETLAGKTFEGPHGGMV